MEKSKLKVFVTRKWPVKVEEYLLGNFDTQLNAQDEPLSQAQLGEALNNYDVVCPTVTDQLGRDLFDSKLVQTKLIANFGVGYNHIALDALKGTGIEVTNTPGVLTDLSLIHI